jgi:hypothetical protein
MPLTSPRKHSPLKTQTKVFEDFRTAEASSAPQSGQNESRKRSPLTLFHIKKIAAHNGIALPKNLTFVEMRAHSIQLKSF